MKLCKYIRGEQMKFLKEYKAYKFDTSSLIVGNGYGVFVYNNTAVTSDVDVDCKGATNVDVTHELLFTGILSKVGEQDLYFVTTSTTKLDCVKLDSISTRYGLNYVLNTVGNVHVIVFHIDIKSLVSYNIDIRPMFLSNWSNGIDIDSTDDSEEEES